MVIALYSVKDQVPVEDFKGVIKAFAHNRVDFLRWGFEKESGVQPEYTSGQYGSLIALKVENPRVTSNHTDADINEMFTIMLHEYEPAIITTSSDFKTHVITIEFPEQGL